MTVAAKASSVEYLENGVTTSFAVPYRFIAAGTLEVRRITSDGTVTTLAYGTQWNATGGTSDAGGTLNLLVGSVSGAKLRIRRVTPRAQTADYATNDRFPAESHEQALDKDMMIEQEQDAFLEDTTSRALLVPEGEVAEEIPATADRAGKFLAFGPGGVPVAASGTGADDGLRVDLASPAAGGKIVAYKAPYTDSIARTIGGKFPDVVGVTDFGTSSDATSMFQKAMAAAQEYGRDLYIPRLDAGAKYLIGENIAVPDMMRLSGGGSGSGSSRVDAGSILEFEDASLDVNDGGGITLENFRVRRAGATPGAAISCVGGGQGFARNFWNNISVINSNDIGVLMSGGWLFTWLNPYVRECRIGVLIEQGAFVTGMNNMTFLGGEVQACIDAGVVLDRCKQVNFVGTAIEGNYGIGLGIGANVTEVNFLGYFEGNLGGHIAAYSHNGGTAGHIANLVVQGGTNFQNGAAASPTTPGPNVPAIYLPKLRSMHIEDQVRFAGYNTKTVPTIQIADVGDSYRAGGSIGQITTDAPPDMVLQNDCLFFGKETRREFYTNLLTTEGGPATPPIRCPIWKGSAIRRNPAKSMSVIIHMDVTGAGGVVTTTRAYDSAGVQIGSNVNNTTTVTAGYNRASITVPDAESVAYITVTRVGTTTSPSDDATGVTFTNIEVLTYENTVKNV